MANGDSEFSTATISTISRASASCRRPALLMPTSSLTPPPSCRSRKSSHLFRKGHFWIDRVQHVQTDALHTETFQAQFAIATKACWPRILNELFRRRAGVTALADDEHIVGVP